MLHDFRDLLNGRRVAPVELQEICTKVSLFRGLSGPCHDSGLGTRYGCLGRPCEGGRSSALHVSRGHDRTREAYYSNGLWLRDPEQVAEEAIELRNEEGFTGSQTSAWAGECCHAIDDLSLEWIEPIVYDNFDVFARLSAELKTPIQIGENFYGSRDLYRALQVKACDLVIRDFMRSAASLGSSGRQRPPERRAFVTFEGRL